MTFLEARTNAWGNDPADERMDIPMGISYDIELKNKAKAAAFYFDNENDLKTFQNSFKGFRDGIAEYTEGEDSEKDKNRECKAQTYNCKVVIDAGAESRY